MSNDVKALCVSPSACGSINVGRVPRSLAKHPQNRGHSQNPLPQIENPSRAQFPFRPPRELFSHGVFGSHICLASHEQIAGCDGAADTPPGPLLRPAGSPLSSAVAHILTNPNILSLTSGLESVKRFLPLGLLSVLGSLATVSLGRPDGPQYTYTVCCTEGAEVGSGLLRG
ncbi:hypothetical protein LZ30DRAFT_307570 [Colletotrichum cereale]|nr:hypothetical protein LZ30DRAFT_307570 [Colletotrichum cereale]